ncbi:MULTISPECIES: type I methionyl aminopeptidase [Clostridia]|uniref:Methionine aminopeptidase n=1 Tax=Lacrimispora celerecrescens TaxID=29354 RepID=A0A084JEP6_9FIRM|nr:MULTISPECIES: type I methionyl aminopeptidase [Clostridia]KEZ87430.1 methionine aminopeptidase [Lacrimispora celerecrescens]MBW4847344.1 type I methionyl aminopeptidase [Lachnospiraceae bacterium]MSS08545.1 type I methionyl aminopeptidase [Clostridium sp. WB02_MRS01]
MFKIGRNDACWCGSGKKYKSCHLSFDQKLENYEVMGDEVPEHYMIKTPAQIEGVRRAGIINNQILDLVEEMIRPGISTEDINTLVHENTIKLGGIPAPLNFEGYPKSVCISINDVVCHGIPDPNRILQEGDIVNVDVTTIFNGYYADASRMFGVGKVSDEALRLMQVTKESVDLALKEARAWGHLGDIGAAISEHIYANGFTVVREIGGHGVGVDFHEEPWVSHIGTRGTDMLLVPGMIFTIEPMVNAGKADVVQDDNDGWTIYTKDGSLSAQWEYTVLITEEGPEVLAR